MASVDYSIAGISAEDQQELITLLSDRLHTLLDLQLTLKHAHWNVVGPQFIAVHELLDPQAAAAAAAVDVIAERIATLGGVPTGTPEAIAKGRDGGEYDIGRANTQDHLKELDRVYSVAIGGHRAAAAKADDLDPITNGILEAQLEELEQNQWFLRAHLG